MLPIQVGKEKEKFNEIDHNNEKQQPSPLRLPAQACRHTRRGSCLLSHGGAGGFSIPGSLLVLLLRGPGAVGTPGSARFTFNSIIVR